MTSTPDDGISASSQDVPAQPLSSDDTTVTQDTDRDPAQSEWDRTTALDDALDAGADVSAIDIGAATDLGATGGLPDLPATATGDDPAQIPADDDDIPAADLPSAQAQPESQGSDDLTIEELGEDGQGDLAPEDI